jgi:uncharacterized protein YjeT (DUF2065 family)
MTLFWTALAFVFLVEGVLPFVSPKSYREMTRKIGEMNDGQIRFIGLISLMIGAGLLLLI